MTDRQHVIAALIACAVVVMVVVITCHLLGMSIGKTLPHVRWFALERAKFFFPQQSDFATHRHPRLAQAWCVTRRWTTLLAVIAVSIFLVYAAVQGTPMDTGLP
jgi:hypothetical protein